MPPKINFTQLGKSPCPDGCEMWRDSRMEDFGSQTEMEILGDSWMAFYGPEWAVLAKQDLACGFTGNPRTYSVTLSKGTAESYEMQFGIKDVWSLSGGENDSNVVTQEINWDVGTIPPGEDGEYRYQILYLIKIFATEYCKNLTWINGVWSYDRKIRREEIMDPPGYAYIICRRYCGKKVGFTPSDNEPPEKRIAKLNVPVQDGA